MADSTLKFSPATRRTTDSDVTLEERDHDCVQLAGYAGAAGLQAWLAQHLPPHDAASGSLVPPAPGTSARVMDGQARLMATGPATWLLLGTARTLETWAHTSTTALLDHAAVCNLSQGRSVALSLRGPAARDVLLMHVSIDLDDAAFPVGACAATGIHHIGVTLLREDADAYLILAPRSFAASLHAFLIDSAMPFATQTGIASQIPH